MNTLFIKDKNLELSELPLRVSPPKAKPPNLFFLFLLVAITLTLFYSGKKPFIEVDDEGNTKLAEWRKEKLNKELNELDEAEQYVLLAKRNGWYPCFNCLISSTIFLNQNEVWKYGYTKKGEGGRYQNSLEGTNLKYVTQFVGTISECMKEEKRKIYYYALMPENLARENPLMRPPGNKQDN